MGALVAFTWQGTKVRTTQRDGDTWFVARDVCDCLDLVNVSQVVSRLPEQSKGIHQMDTLGGSQEMTIVSEPGVYQLAFTSSKKEAIQFQQWVFHEVLPAIRKTGSYSADLVFGPQSRSFDNKDRSDIAHMAYTKNGIVGLIEISNHCLKIVDEIKKSSIAVKAFKEYQKNLLSVPYNADPLKTRKRPWDTE